MFLICNSPTNNRVTDGPLMTGNMIDLTFCSLSALWVLFSQLWLSWDSKITPPQTSKELIPKYRSVFLQKLTKSETLFLWQAKNGSAQITKRFSEISTFLVSKYVDPVSTLYFFQNVPRPGGIDSKVSVPNIQCSYSACAKCLIE